MPGRDGTGPMGIGRMTGRGAGPCAGFTEGFGYGYGRGRGPRRMFYSCAMPGWARYGNPAYGGLEDMGDAEKELLNRQAEFLEKQLQQVKKRLSSLDKAGE